MTLPRKTLWLLLSAIPTLLVATAAAYILLRFLAVRDRLGTWQVIVQDPKGAEVGHGHLDLMVTAWTTSWTWSAPFVTFTPTMNDQAGVLTFDTSLPPMDGFSIEAGPHAIINPGFCFLLPNDIPAVLPQVMLGPDSFMVFTVHLESDLPHPTGPMYKWQQGLGNTPALPLTVQVHR